MGSKHLYNNGLPFSTVLKVNLDDLIQRVDNKKASCLIIDGGLGEGKTTLGSECGDYIQGQYIDLKKQIGMGGEDFQAKFKICLRDKLLVCIYDEAGDFDRRGAISGFNRMINRLFQIYRGFKIIVILCLPNFSILDMRFFEMKIPRLLLHCHDRLNSYGNFMGYDLDGMFWLKKYMENKKNISLKAYNYVKPNFRGHFKDLIPERSAELDKLSTESKTKILGENVAAVEGLDYKEIAYRVGRSKDWVKKKISELKIKPSARKSGKNYFDEETVEIVKKEVAF